MSELQSESGDIQDSAPAIENPDNGAELAPASESEHITNTETVDEVESEASKQQKYINTQYGQIKQGERDLAKANEQLAKFESDARERQSTQVNNLPEWPDEFDDNFEQKKANYLEAVSKQSDFNAEQRIYGQQQQFTQQQAVQAKAVENQKVIQEHNARTAKLGIKPEEMLQAENAVLQYRLPPELLSHIASMDDSPLVIKYLAANAQDGHTLASMPVYAVGSFLDGIKAKASALKPKTSNAPAPATNLQGNGAAPNDGYNNIKGATFT